MDSEKIKKIVESQRIFYKKGETLPFEFRVNQLKKLKEAVRRYEKEFTRALKDDLGKPEFEAYSSEIGFTLHEITYTLKNLKKWMKPKKVKRDMLTQPSSGKIHFSPLGLNLIIAPFNYPLQLTLAPLVVAISAGNCAVIKTSELTPNVSDSIEKLINETFDPEYIAYVPGEIPETTALLEQKFDHIFFTGSPFVGSIVMQAAAKNLTPVTLELGGKSPCIVHSDAKLDLAARRIVFGKFMNAGQTCIAPDYILVHRSIKDDFLNKIKERIRQVYGEDPKDSEDFGRIVSERHLNRIVNLIDTSKIVIGGESSVEERYIAPTVLKDVTLSDEVMKDEIFGPVLPVLEYETFDDIVEIIEKLPQHPLACYVFSENKEFQKKVVESIQFGGCTINHCIQHIVNPNLPFGGVGESGIGSYHGFEGFKRFSHSKSILTAATWFDMKLIYPPYKGKLKILKKIMK